VTTYAKVEQKHTDDERWIAAGADAFAVHIAAIVYCDRQLSDGHISDAMARRVSLAVPPERADQAITALVEHGFWRRTKAGFLIVNFHEHAFPAEQVKRTQERWKADKDRRRQHGIGDHSLCKDPKFCPAIRAEDSTVDSTVAGTVESTRIDKTKTRPDQDQTRPEEGEGWSGNGMGKGGSDSSHVAAELRRDSSPLPPTDTEDDPPPADPQPWANAGPPAGYGIIVNDKLVKPREHS
jgi:hypothetical protein